MADSYYLSASSNSDADIGAGSAGRWHLAMLTVYEIYDLLLAANRKS